MRLGLGGGSLLGKPMFQTSFFKLGFVRIAGLLAFDCSPTPRSPPRPTTHSPSRTTSAAPRTASPSPPPTTNKKLLKTTVLVECAHVDCEKLQLKVLEVLAVPKGERAWAKIEPELPLL